MKKLKKVAVCEEMACVQLPKFTFGHFWPKFGRNIARWFFLRVLRKVPSFSIRFHCGFFARDDLSVKTFLLVAVYPLEQAEVFVM